MISVLAHVSGQNTHRDDIDNTKLALGRFMFFFFLSLFSR